MRKASSWVYTRPASDFCTVCIWFSAPALLLAGKEGGAQGACPRVTFSLLARLQDEISHRRCMMQLSSGPAGQQETPLGRLYQRHWLGLYSAIRQQISSGEDA